jgi:cysteine synthase
MSVDNLTDLIGGMPLLRLDLLGTGLGAEILAKLEMFNVGLFR